MIAVLPVITHGQIDTSAFPAEGFPDPDQLIDSLVEPPGQVEDEEVIIDSGTAIETQPTYFRNTGDYYLDTYHPRRLSNEQKLALKKDPDYWYADYVFGDKSSGKNKNVVTDRDPPFYLLSWFQTLMWVVIIGGFVAVLILYLRNNNVSLFRNTRRINEDQSGPLQQDILSLSYDEEIARAANLADYRLATRFLYLRLLKQLSDRNMIQYKPERTNFDYMAELSGSQIYNDFFRLTRHYEYAWYGQFILTQEQYSRVQQDFEGLTKKLRGH